MAVARIPRVVFFVGVASLLGAMAVPARAITYDLVAVGNAGNANDTTGYGAVAYDYQIGKYDVTIGQYTAFLNAVAATDTYSLYHASMATDLAIAGISQAGSPGTYTYSVIAPSGSNPPGASSPGNRPITYVSWFDSARFANWMANGQPTGAQNSTTTENGAYNINGATTGVAPAKNVTNPNTGTAPTFFIPSGNEWYKAAYYSPTRNGSTGGYYLYATQSSTAPGNVLATAANRANYYTGAGYSVTQSTNPPSSQNYLTDVGAFSGSGSFYGTFDQSGNVYQWNDLDGVASLSRGIRGGAWSTNGPFYLSASGSYVRDPSSETAAVGFRLAAPVPEPSTCASLLAGLACGGYLSFRRRKQD
jgi:formylglycine-generating enzyme required for sulfatase activity